MIFVVVVAFYVALGLMLQIITRVNRRKGRKVG